MSYWSGFLLGTALFLYASGVAVSLWVLTTRRRRGVYFIPFMALAGFVVHFAGIVARGVEEGGVPLGNIRGILFLLAWVAVSVYLFAHFRFRVEVMGIIILPLVVLLMLVTLVLPPAAGDEASQEGMKGAARLIHIVPAILGVSALFLTFASSLLYLIQERALKSRRPLQFFLKLPSLESCERLGHQSLTWGFLLLTFVVATGVVSTGYRGGGDWGWLLNEKWSLMAWLLFAVVMYDRIFSGGWRGRKAAYLSILGFGAMILRMMGV